MTYAHPSWPLLVHIGCGDSADLELAAKSEYVFLVEPDSELALRARVWLESQSLQGEVCEFAVADAAGPAVLNRMSYASMNSVRALSAARDLFPGMRPVGAQPVETIKPRDLLESVRWRMKSGGCALVIDAPSEGLLILKDLDEAGCLTAFDHVQLITPSVPLHEGGCDRTQIEAWALARDYKLRWDPQPEDPELVQAYLTIDWSARIERERAVVQALQRDLVEARNAFDSASEEARSSADLLEQVQTDLLASRQALAQLQQALLAAQNEKTELLNAARSACADILQTSDLSAQLVSDQGASLEADLKLVHDQHAEALRLLEEQKAARDKAMEAAEANLEAFNAERARREDLKSVYEQLQSDYQAEQQSVQRLSQEVDGLREDNSLSLRIQRLAQADLSDLQARYQAVQTQKSELERILEEFSVRLHQEVAQQKLTAAANKKSSKKLTSKSKSKAAKSSKS